MSTIPLTDATRAAFDGIEKLEPFRSSPYHRAWRSGCDCLVRRFSLWKRETFPRQGGASVYHGSVVCDRWTLSYRKEIVLSVLQLLSAQETPQVKRLTRGTWRAMTPSELVSARVMKVRMEPIGSVKPYPSNPRRAHDVHGIARSIRAFGVPSAARGLRRRRLSHGRPRPPPRRPAARPRQGSRPPRIRGRADPGAGCCLPPRRQPHRRGQRVGRSHAPRRARAARRAERARRPASRTPTSPS